MRNTPCTTPTLQEYWRWRTPASSCTPELALGGDRSNCVEIGEGKKDGIFLWFRACVSALYRFEGNKGIPVSKQSMALFCIEPKYSWITEAVWLPVTSRIHLVYAWQRTDNKFWIILWIKNQNWTSPIEFVWILILGSSRYSVSLSCILESHSLSARKRIDPLNPKRMPGSPIHLPSSLSGWQVLREKVTESYAWLMSA